MARTTKPAGSAASKTSTGEKRKSEPEDDGGPISKRTRASRGRRESPESPTTAGNGGPDGKSRQDRDGTRESKGGSKGPRGDWKKTRGGSGTKSRTRRISATSTGDGDDAPQILEKGIIYFFFRGRVRDKTADGADEKAPSSVDDVARSHIALRPFRSDKQATDNIADSARLLAVPKKFLPRTGRDRFMAMVEKGPTDIATLRDTLRGSDHETKTRGARHQPAAAPLAEGVYVMTSTGRESHLAYIVTLPEDLGEVQKAMGLKERGSFIISTKNPKNDGPPNARFPQKPEYPDEVMKDFGSLRWLPSQPRHLDYPNTQLLLIGESSGLEKATGVKRKKGEDGGDESSEAGETLEELEDEDTKRMRHLAGDQSDAIFADLQLRADEYPKLKTTF
ncbi:hypothetical protein MAPG_04160 [Magnaporthiopsis poae ATCC 64411]|uniref:BTB domain transcription factor n=1 Tax=Magnaporthiopsis poae (strain ATCC 64411 / 73-15) TaxID=644358 RepID=A0A0C4DVZ2_MAGP6|nr:hypothetical protein MAPG_04160 [Magnaporthiopsis poae ATCC 64411]